jgi:hypothetical protein
LWSLFTLTQFVEPVGNNQSSSLYAAEDVAYDAQVVYPKSVETGVDEAWLETQVKTLDLQDEALRARYEALTLEQYVAHFRRDRSKFDVFERNFQDCALLFTHGKSREELLDWLAAGADDALGWLVRARSVAMATRADVDWRGEPQFAADFADRRAAELRERWRASRLFHWQLDAANGDAVWNEIKAHVAHGALERGRRAAPVEVVAQAHLDAVVRVAEELPASVHIAWATKSTSHICGGNFSSPATLRWRGEHALATLTDAVGSVSLRAEHGAAPHAPLPYRAGQHVPPGGALSARAKLLFAKKQPDTTVLLAPFPRRAFGGTPEARAALSADVLRAMAGVVKSALALGVDVLVLPSGAAGHTADEAFAFGALWGRVLKPTRLHFQRVVIAAGEQLPPDVFKALTQGVRSTVSGASQAELSRGEPRPAPPPAAAAAAAAEQLVADTAAELAQDRAAAEQQAKLDALDALERSRAAAAERAAAERAARAKSARDRFRALLRTAMAAHEQRQFKRAVDLYADGLAALGEAFSLETDPALKEDLRLQFDRYIRIAEAAKEEAKKLDEL